MSGPFLVCEAVLNAPISVSVDCSTSLMCTFGCSCWYFAIMAFIHLFAPGASLSAQYQYVRLPAFASSVPLLALPLEPPQAAASAAVVKTAAAVTSALRASTFVLLLREHYVLAQRASVHVWHCTGSRAIMVRSAGARRRPVRRARGRGSEPRPARLRRRRDTALLPAGALRLDVHDVGRLGGDLRRRRGPARPAHGARGLPGRRRRRRGLAHAAARPRRRRRGRPPPAGPAHRPDDPLPARGR